MFRGMRQANRVRLRPSPLLLPQKHRLARRLRKWNPLPLWQRQPTREAIQPKQRHSAISLRTIPRTCRARSRTERRKRAPLGEVSRALAIRLSLPVRDGVARSSDDGNPLYITFVILHPSPGSLILSTVGRLVMSLVWDSNPFSPEVIQAHRDAYARARQDFIEANGCEPLSPAEYSSVLRRAEAIRKGEL